MATGIELNGDTVGIGRSGFAALRQALERHLGEQAASYLQDAGHLAGTDLYRCFQRWIASTTGLDDPGAVEASQLGTLLSEFFQALGWGRLVLNRVGHKGLALESDEWVEADPQAQTPAPSCYLSAGLLAGFMGALAQQPVAVLEVECRSASQPRCRFLLGRPEVVEAAYQAITDGRDYQSAI